MVPALQFDNWQWLSLTLAAPVVVWGAWPFHRAAWANLRHGAATMDTLVSVGTLAALGWSLCALFLGTAGKPGMTHPFELTVERSDGAGNIYLEVAAGVTTFILAGRYFEARVQAAGRRRAAGAARARARKDVAVLRDGRRGADPGRAARRRRPVRRAARREGRHRRRRRAGQLGGRRVDAHRRVACRSRSGPATRSSAPPSTPAAGSSCAPPGSAPTPSSRRWRGWSRTPRTARPRCSGSPTGSPAVFVPIVIGARRRHPRLLARHRRRRVGGVHRRRRGADHRLPVRARPGHADRAAWSAPAAAPSSAS